MFWCNIHAFSDEQDIDVWEIILVYADNFTLMLLVLLHYRISNVIWIYSKDLILKLHKFIIFWYIIFILASLLHYNILLLIRSLYFVFLVKNFRK